MLRVADAPRAKHLVCVRFDVRAVQGVNGYDDELRFRFFAQFRADLPNSFGISRTNHVRRIDDVLALRRSRRHGGIGVRTGKREEADDDEEEGAQLSACVEGVHSLHILS